MTESDEDCKRYVYSRLKSFSVKLKVVVTFTVVYFGQVQSRKKRNVYSRLIRSSLFGHLYSVIFTSLIKILKHN